MWQFNNQLKIETLPALQKPSYYLYVTSTFFPHKEVTIILFFMVIISVLFLIVLSPK